MLVAYFRSSVIEQTPVLFHRHPLTNEMKILTTTENVTTRNWQTVADPTSSQFEKIFGPHNQYLAWWYVVMPDRNDASLLRPVGILLNREPAAPGAESEDDSFDFLELQAVDSPSLVHYNYHAALPTNYLGPLNYVRSDRFFVQRATPFDLPLSGTNIDLLIPCGPWDPSAIDSPLGRNVARLYGVHFVPQSLPSS